jgi:hypothetical protein
VQGGIARLPWLLATAVRSQAAPAIIICAPILEPPTKSVGMGSLHSAMIRIVSLAFGLVTPPYGLCPMISSAVAGIRIRHQGHRHHAGADADGTGVGIVWPKVSLLLPSRISPEFLR